MSIKFPSANLVSVTFIFWLLSFSRGTITVNYIVIWLKHVDSSVSDFNYFLIKAMLDSLWNFFSAS